MNDTLLIVAMAILLFVLVTITLLRRTNAIARGQHHVTGPLKLDMGFSHAGATIPGLSSSGPLNSGPLRARTSEVDRSSNVPAIIPKRPSAPIEGVSPRIIMGSDYLQNGRLSHLPSFREGREGESRVVQQVASQLGGRWTLFRNLDLPDKDGDIDIVLVGPGGIYAIEVKAYTGNFRVEKGRYYKETSSGRMARLQRGPGAQARTNSIRLYNYLKAQGMTRNTFVTPVVALAKDILIEVDSTATVIWTQTDIDEHVSELKSLSYLSPYQVERIVRILEAIPTTLHRTVH